MSTKITCNVCSNETKVVFQSDGEASLTSLCQVIPGSTIVRYCSFCGHLQTDPIEEIEKFYDSEYKILINTPDEDQIYEVSTEKIKYRSEHQIDVLLKKIDIADRNIKVLDYGCAKGDMSLKLKKIYQKLDFHFFDVSRMYLDYWKKIATEDKFAVNITPNDWQQNFELITAYFSFEHIPNPINAAKHVYSLLSESGKLYAIVPNFITNPSDFIVVDHVNHFTSNSLEKLFLDAGFDCVEIDENSHRGAFVVIAHKNKKMISNKIADVNSNLISEIQKISKFWENINNKIKLNEDKKENSAIYGSSVYGSYIYSQLKNKDNIKCFVDKNPFLQGRNVMGVPIINPDNLPANIEKMYVGLNPTIARKVISEYNNFGNIKKFIFLE